VVLTRLRSFSVLYTVVHEQSFTEECVLPQPGDSDEDTDVESLQHQYNELLLEEEELLAMGR